MPDPDSLGGPAACEPPFVAELRRQGADVDEEIYVYGEKLSRTTFVNRVNRVLRAALRLRRKLESGPFDLLHLNSSFDSRALLRDVVTCAIVGRRTKIFIKFHGSDADLLNTNNRPRKFLVRRLLSRADGIAVLSTEERQNFVSAGWAEEKFFLVKNVVDRNFSEGNGTFNSRHGLPAEVSPLLFIARFIPAKGLLDVIRACGLLRDGGQKCVLFCIGDGPARAEAEVEVARLNLKDQVRFTGFIPEKQTAEFYVNSSILVLPTYHIEGFPMTVFYAVAAGMPIITTRIRGAADYLEEPENCLWVEPRDPAMLAEKIALLLNNQEMREAMSLSNRKLAGHFSAKLVTREYLQAYRTVIDRRLALCEANDVK
ncbi:MAG: glycosyltransferase family 4 protein [Pyrinomonadaceae bacterium]